MLGKIADCSEARLSKIADCRMWIEARQDADCSEASQDADCRLRCGLLARLGKMRIAARLGKMGLQRG